MGILDRLTRKTKEERKKEIERKIELTELEKLCADEPEIYEALKDTMLLDPRNIDFSIEDAVAKAKEFERKKENLRAATWYKIAGGLAIYEADVSKIKEYFGKFSKLTKKELKILEIPEKAMKKAHEYYSRILKRPQK